MAGAAFPRGVHRQAGPQVAQRLVKEVKGSKLKVQIAIQGDELRVSGKKRDDLQAAIALFRQMKIALPLQYVNFRE